MMSDPGLAGGEPPWAGITEEDERFLLRLARRAVAAAARGEPVAQAEVEHLEPRMEVPLACFVTLRKGGELRGCIGQLLARDPLWQAVIRNAESAAVRDYRFSPVTDGEVDGLTIEISVLSVPEQVEFDNAEDLLARLRPGVDGVILKVNGGVSTFLPQVWEDLPDKEQFLNHLCQKGGHAPDAWRGQGVEVSIYQVRAFSE